MDKPHPQRQQEKTKWQVTIRKNMASGWRGFAVWFKTVFLVRKDYVPGDSCRFIWQKVPEVARSFVYYRIGHMIGSLFLFCISFLHVFGEPKERFCETEPTVLCLGQSARVQYEWFFYATSWGILINFTQSVWGLVLTLRVYSRQKKAQKMAVDVESAKSGIDRIRALKDSQNVDQEKKIPLVHTSAPSDYKRPRSASKDDGNLVEGNNFLVDTRSKKSIKQDVAPKTSTKPVKNPKTKSIPESTNPSATKEHKILSKTGFYWGLHTYALCSSLLIDVVYWTLIWPVLMTSPRVYFIQVDEHGLNLPLMIADYCLVAFPRTLSHFWFTALIPLFYLLINCVYYLAGGRSRDRTKHHVYPFLDWKKPGKALAYGIFIGLGLSIFLLIFLVIDHYKFRYRPKALSNITPKNLPV